MVFIKSMFTNVCDNYSFIQSDKTTAATCGSGVPQ